MSKPTGLDPRLDIRREMYLEEIVYLHSLNRRTKDERNRLVEQLRLLIKEVEADTSGDI